MMPICYLKGIGFLATNKQDVSGGRFLEVYFSDM